MLCLAASNSGHSLDLATAGDRAGLLATAPGSAAAACSLPAAVAPLMSAHERGADDFIQDTHEQNTN